MHTQSQEEIYITPWASRVLKDFVLGKDGALAPSVAKMTRRYWQHFTRSDWNELERRATPSLVAPVPDIYRTHEWVFLLLYRITQDICSSPPADRPRDPAPLLATNALLDELVDGVIDGYRRRSPGISELHLFAFIRGDVKRTMPRIHLSDKEISASLKRTRP